MIRENWYHVNGKAKADPSSGSLSMMGLLCLGESGVLAWRLWIAKRSVDQERVNLAFQAGENRFPL